MGRWVWTRSTVHSISSGPERFWKIRPKVKGKVPGWNKVYKLVYFLKEIKMSLRFRIFSEANGQLVRFFSLLLLWQVTNALDMVGSLCLRNKIPVIKVEPVFSMQCHSQWGQNKLEDLFPDLVSSTISMIFFMFGIQKPSESHQNSKL